MANALAKVGDEFQPLVPPRGSVAAHVHQRCPASLVAAAFHHLPAKELADLDHPIEGDVLICSDHPDGHRRRLRDRRPASPGSVRSTRVAGERVAPIEAFTAVLLQLNVRYKHPGRGTAHRHRRRPLTMRLYDTARRAVVPFEPGPDRHDVHVRHHAVRRHAHRPRRHLRHLRRPAAPAARPRPRHAVRAQRHRRRRRHPAQGTRARRALSRPRRRGDGPLRRGHACPRAAARRFSEPRATSAIADILGFVGMVSTGATRTRPAAPCTSASPRSSASDRSVTTRATRCSLSPREHGGQPDDPQQARPARLRPVAAIGSRANRRGTRCGVPAAPAGTSNARRCRCASSAPPSTCTAAAAT